MAHREQGFSLLELLAALLIMGIVAAFALPSAVTAVKNYRLHADATSLASYLNIVRMRAASQYAPYRLVMQDPALGGTGAYGMERLCGITPTSIDANCTGPYQPFTTRQFEVGVGGGSMGSQYLGAGDTLTGCRPTGVSSPPLSTITGDLTASSPPCSTQAYFCFNTRGLPVDSSGNPLSNGGNVVYVQNMQGLLDAITVSIGGRVTTWNWSPGSNKWRMR
jgi:prepilin-type N-terminal cleavage/methylation domain-containing protein